VTKQGFFKISQILFHDFNFEIRCSCISRIAQYACSSVKIINQFIKLVYHRIYPHLSTSKMSSPPSGVERMQQERHARMLQGEISTHNYLYKLVNALKPLSDSDSPYIHRSKKRKLNDFGGHKPVLSKKLTRSISMPSAQVQRPNGSKAKPYIIGVVGGTNSGKSSVCKKIITEVSKINQVFSHSFSKFFFRNYFAAVKNFLQRL
jgi:hypothetical protein